MSSSSEEAVDVSQLAREVVAGGPVDDLILATARSLRAFIAGYALDRPMLEAVFAGTWVAAVATLEEWKPDSGFPDWLQEAAVPVLLESLEKAHAQAVARTDPLAYSVLEAAIAALHVHDRPAALIPDLTLNIKSLEPPMRDLLGKRYVERLTLDSIARIVAVEEREVAKLLVLARAALVGQHGLAADLLAQDRLLPLLLEDHLSGTLVDDARRILASSVLKDFTYCALLERQVRCDLQLATAMGNQLASAARAVADRLRQPLPVPRPRLPISDRLRAVRRLA